MEKKDKDIALFVAFCIEEYGAAKGMTGDQVLDLFRNMAWQIISAIVSNHYIPKGANGS